MLELTSETKALQGQVCCGCSRHYQDQIAVAEECGVLEKVQEMSR